MFEARSVSQMSSSSDKQIKIEGYGDDDESSTKKIKKVFEEKTKIATESQNLTSQRKLSSSSSSSSNSSSSKEEVDEENGDNDIIDKLNDMCNLKTQQIKAEQEKEDMPKLDSDTMNFAKSEPSDSESIDDSVSMDDIKDKIEEVLEKQLNSAPLEQGLKSEYPVETSPDLDTEKTPEAKVVDVVPFKDELLEKASKDSKTDISDENTNSISSDDPKNLSEKENNLKETSSLSSKDESDGEQKNDVPKKDNAH